MLGDAYRHSSAPGREERECYYSQACDLSVELGLRPECARCKMALGQLLMESGRQAEAEQLIGSAVELCRSMGMVETAILPGHTVDLNSSCSVAAVS
jgi:hypothetical protein